MNGIICVNKPSGWTSFDIVAKVRGMARTKKVGHAGTLDPMATGVLPLFLGNATKVCDILPNDRKGYIAEFQFGMTTDTLDITGTVQTQTKSSVTEEKLRGVMEQYTGMISQIPPMFSAVQVNGQRLYDLARAGQQVQRKPRQVTIYLLKLISFDEKMQTAKIEVLCSKGTYIRSLCSDIGETLGVGAVLTSLVRHIAGDFTLSDCYTLEELQQMTDSGTLEQSLMPVERVFESCPDIRLNDIQSKKFLNGVRLDLNRVFYQEKKGFHRVFNQDHLFLGLASLNMDTMELVIEKMFERN